MGKLVLTIGREYGSGVRYIGEQVAKRLGIKFYDKELLHKVYEKNGFSYSKLEEYDESKKNEFMKTLNLLNMNSFDLSVFDEDEVQLLINDAVKDAAREACVILGRNANNILKDKENVIDIFIYSNNTDFKIKRKMEMENVDFEMASLKLKKIDKKRKKYYEYLNPGSIWGQKSEYDFIIDSGKFGIEKTIDIIVDMYNKLSN